MGGPVSEKLLYNKQNRNMERDWSDPMKDLNLVLLEMVKWMLSVSNEMFGES